VFIWIIVHLIGWILHLELLSLYPCLIKNKNKLGSQSYHIDSAPIKQSTNPAGNRDSSSRTCGRTSSNESASGHSSQRHKGSLTRLGNFRAVDQRYAQDKGSHPTDLTNCPVSGEGPIKRQASKPGHLGSFNATTAERPIP
jgi:hypothetical protein